MLPLLMRAGIWALKFTGKRAISSPLITATMAHMATDGKSTDMALDSIEGAGHLIGKENAKTAAKATAGFVGSLSLAWAQMTGKVVERAGGAAFQNIKDKIATPETPAASEQTATPSITPAPSATAKPTRKEKAQDEKSPFNNAFSMAAGGGLGALLGGMSGNPVIMIIGALLAIMMMGNLFGEKDDKPKPNHPAPSP